MADRYDNSSLGNSSLGNNTSHAADKALGSHDEPRTTGDVVGETVGGLSGAATGAALGSLGGPIGTIIGGIAGAVTGWWSGRAISEAASSFDQDEDYYRGHYSSRSSAGSTGFGSASTGQSSLGSSSMSGSAMGSADLGSAGTSGSGTGSSFGGSYDHVRPAYQLGHLAGMNPDYKGRQFDDVEPDLQRGWNNQSGESRTDWNHVRDYAREAYGRGQQRGSSLGSSGSMGSGAAGMGAAGLGSSTMDRETGLSGAQDRAHDSGLLDRAADKLDDLKDRFDGNPNSRPGPDSSDRRF